MSHARIVLLVSLLASSCTVLRVDSNHGPPRIESSGVIDSHVALGIPSETHLIHASLFEGASQGAIAELTLWKLFHLELGLAGVAVGLGPIHVGLGVALYEPEIPPMMRFDSDERPRSVEKPADVPVAPVPAAEPGGVDESEAPEAPR